MITLTVTLWQLALIVYFIVGLVGLLIIFTGEHVGAVKFDSYLARFNTLVLVMILWPWFVYMSMKAAAELPEKNEDSPENE